MIKFNRTFGFLGIAAMSVAAYAIQTSQPLILDGTVISNKLTVVNGQYLVPVTDIAKYLGYQFKMKGQTGVLTRIATDGVAGSPPLPTPPPPTAPTSNNLTPPPPAMEAAQEFAPNPNPRNDMPTTAVPGTAITTATANLFPDASQIPTRVSTKIGKVTSVNGFDYKVDSIQNVGRLYKEQYDQRGQTIHPAWKNDNLSVIDLSVTNHTSQPMSVFTPGLGDLTVFDDHKIGFPAIAIDIRQSPEALSSDMTYEMSGMGETGDLMLAPGGTIKYAIVASMAKNDSISSLLINIPANSNSYSGSANGGATITVTQ